MREFNARGQVLRRLERGSRLVYAGFLVFLAAALLTAALLHADSMGASTATATAWWVGDEAAMVYPKSYRQMLELTHFHLFTEPVIWLVVAHLYHLGGGRGFVSLGTLAAMAVQIALPWLVVYVAPGFGMALLPATAAVTVGLAWMIAVSLYELGTPRSS